MSENKKLKEDIKEARRKIYDDFMENPSEDNRKNVDMITKLEIEKQKEEDDLRLREDEAEFNYSQDEDRLNIEKERLTMDQEKHKAEMDKIQYEKDLADKKFKLDMLKDGLELFITGVTAKKSYDITKGLIEYNKTRPFPLDRSSFDAAKRFMEQSARGVSKIFRR